MALANLYRCVQDIAGNVVPQVMATITLTATGALALLYADADGTQPLPNPTVNDSQYGTYDLFLGAGLYNISYAKDGYTFEPQTHIELRDPSSGVTTITGTPNQVLVSSAVGAVVLSTPQNLDPDADIQFGHLGLGTPATGNRLQVSGNSHLVGLLTVTGHTHMDTAQVGIGQQAGYELTVNRFYAVGPSWCNAGLRVEGQALNANSGILVGPAGVKSSGWVRIGDQAAPAYTLDVNGDTYLRAHTGIGAAPLPGQYNLNAGSAQIYTLTTVASASIGADCQVLGNLTASQNLRVGPGLVSQPGYWLNAINGYFRDGLVCAGGLTTGNATINSVLQATSRIFTGSIGLGGIDPPGDHAIYSPGDGYVNLKGLTGIGTGPTAGYNLTTPVILATSAGWKPGGGDWADSSSRQHKSAITPIVGALDLLLAQHGVQFEWILEPHRRERPGKQYGLVAEDVTIPQWRVEDASGQPGLCHYGAVALIIEALRELSTRLLVLEEGAP